MDKKISELTETTSLQAGDLFVVAKDMGGGAYENRKVQSGNVTPSGVVLQTTDQTINGIKTFTSFPVSPSGYPVDDFQFANKKYVDDKMNVSAYYIIASQQTLGVGPATSLLDFATKIHDSHNAVTTGASWKFTAPISGRYLIGGLIATDDAVWRVDDTVSFGIRIDNTTDYTLGSLKGGGTQYGLIPTGSIVMNLLQNQYVQIWGQEWRSGATYTSNGRVQIDRIGGYIS